VKGNGVIEVELKSGQITHTLFSLPEKGNFSQSEML